jgi:NAD(P)-dependent dehydrogenase (short-subunit alcohol dehydrogenase family)
MNLIILLAFQSEGGRMTTIIKRVALVTGANRGIGFEIAKQLAAKNITVLMGVRNQDSGIQAQKRLTQAGLDVHLALIDVTDFTSIQAAIDRIKDQFGRIDVLVNNAGIQIDAKTSILELSLSFFLTTLETNTFGPLLLSQACIPLMREQKYGRIVNISSTLGAFSDIMHPASNYHKIDSPAYRLSKTLLNGITALLAKELHGTNILANSVCPGWVRTSLGGQQAPLSPAQAADTPVWLATLPDSGPSGGFFWERQSIPW